MEKRNIQTRVQKKQQYQDRNTDAANGDHEYRANRKTKYKQLQFKITQSTSHNHLPKTQHTT